MREVKHLSPSSLSLFYKNREEFYIKYLSEERLQRDPQQQPMAAGSAVDAFIKSYLHNAIFGNYGKNNEYELKTIFDAQVEPHNREWAWPVGEYLFKRYKETGALPDLLLQLKEAVGEPRFEIEISSKVDGEHVSKPFGDVILLGKPDLFFLNKNGFPVILDYKVNGYCSKASPKKGYVEIRGDNGKSGSYKDAMIIKHQGIRINVATNLEDVDPDWAAQLSIYAWLLGVPVGDDFIVAIDQFVCNSEKKKDGFPEVRIAEHRLRVDKQWQKELFQKVIRAWEAIKSGHLFFEYPREKSDELVAAAAAKLKGYQSDDPTEAALFREMKPGWF